MGNMRNRWRGRLTGVGQGMRSTVQLSVRLVHTNASNFADRDHHIITPPEQEDRVILVDFTPQAARDWAKLLLKTADEVEARRSRK